MSTSKKSDEELALMVAEQAPDFSAHEPFQILYKRLGKRTELYISARVDVSLVPDIHQETWTKAWRFAHQFTAGKKYMPWLLVLAKSTIINKYRYQKIRPQTQLEVDVAGPSVDLMGSCHLVDEERSLALQSCIERLDKHAVRLVRGRLAGASYAKLCGQLDLTESKAHKMFFNAKNSLQDCLQAKMS